MIGDWLRKLADGLKPTSPAASALSDTARRRLFAAMEERAVPCVRLSSIKAGAPVRSRLGGLPAIDGRFEWPHWHERPLSFVAHVELAEIAAASKFDWLPDSGRLLFFYDSEQDAWGFDPKDEGAWAVYFDPAEQPAPAAEPPPGLPSHGRYPEVAIEAAESVSFPGPERLGEVIGELPDDEWAAVDERRRSDLPAHQIGGYPSPVQGEGMELECQLASNGVYVGDSEGYSSPQAQALQAGASDWRLLLQLDSNDAADMMWGDVGMLYFWVRKQDSANKDFSNVWMVLQCF